MLVLDKRRIAAIVATLLVITLATTGAALVWARADNKKRDVAVPPDTASPATVVATYLHALDARDCRTVEALWNGTTTFCSDVESVRDIHVQDPNPQPADDALETYVPAEFTISWRWLHVNPSLNGDIAWGYYLSRETPQSAWRLDRGAAG